MARAADFDLTRALGVKGFTPAQRDAVALAELVAKGDEPAATRALPALAGLGEAGGEAIVGALGATGDDGARARLIAALGLHARAGDGTARGKLIEPVGDGAVRVRRAAIVALGKLGTVAEADVDDARATLIARWDAAEVPADERRALAEALGKLGGDAALARLRGLAAGDDAELTRRRDRALLMADRTARRDAPSEIAIDVPPPARVTVRLHCKAGLADLLADELRARGIAPAPVSDAAVDVALDQPWATLHASRLWTHGGIRVPLAASTAPAITAAITAPAVRALLAAWTRGPIRWRLQLAHGHQRAVVWRVARDVTAAAPELLNDPTATTWDLLVDDSGTALELVPRRAADPRFGWRTAEVPASSHPTVAAALAALAGAQAGDRVWDPFCGAGAELVERTRLVGPPPRSLHGSDLDETALAAARENLAAAGATATLAQADARTHDPGEVDLVITNPPLGSRVHVNAAALLTAALPSFARHLAPRGRLVWITPAPRATGPAAEAAGLVRTYHASVDLGGVRGVLERWEPREPAPRNAR